MRRLAKGGAAVFVAAAVLAACLVTGCRSTEGSSGPQAAMAENPALEAAAGAEIWAANCGRCHNLRDPGSYDAEEWRIAVHHMRLRVPLTGEQERSVTEFLSSR